MSTVGGAAPEPQYLRLADGTKALVVRGASVHPEKGLVVLPGLPGMNPQFVNLCRELANAYGLSICAPELISETATTFDERDASVASVNDQVTLRRLRLAAEATGAEHVSILGFCIGGTFTYKSRGLGVFERSVAFYGIVEPPERWQSEDQRPPLSYLRGRETPLLAIVGGRDPFIPAADAEALRQAGAEVIWYPDAQHAFAHDSQHDNYRVDDSRDAWAHAIEFLGVAGANTPFHYPVV